MLILQDPKTGRFLKGNKPPQTGTGRPREGQSECPICKKVFSWKRISSNNPPKTCSKECRYLSASKSMKGQRRVMSFPGERVYKRKAQRMIQRMVRIRMLWRLPCKVCGKNPTEAHHYLGYEPEHWLDILWLCSKCHHKEHERLKKNTR